MINLNIQIELIIFSFIYGILFSILLDIFNKKTIKINKYLKILFSFLFIMLMSIIYFIGIIKIDNALLHIYSIISIILGFIVYDILIKLIAK